jgi:protein-tyrosine phosphatase
MLMNCPNFRDIGGHETCEGRSVRRGRVFRSGLLNRLGDEENALLAPLQIGTICDLRDMSERAKEPSHWFSIDAEMLNWDYRSPFLDLMTALERPDATAADSTACMKAFYRLLPGALAEAIKAIFVRIANHQTPLIVHCSAGKDRTGVVVGMLLEVVGVPRSTVLADYSRSADLVNYEGVLTREPAARLGLAREGFSMASLARERRAPLLASDPS